VRGNLKQARTLVNTYKSVFPNNNKRKLSHSARSAIRHRGPDDDGFYFTERVGLGMRRLSIIDVAGGQQPIHNQDRSAWIVFNGEIYS
jgi:asparagine synthetase B (glutamine-hydrolysing)